MAASKGKKIPGKNFPGIYTSTLRIVYLKTEGEIEIVYTFSTLSPGFHTQIINKKYFYSLLYLQSF